MGGAEDHVERIRDRLPDRGHRFDGDLIALARADQPEAEDGRSTVELELGLADRGIDRTQVRHSVRDDVEPPWVDVTRPDQPPSGALRITTDASAKRAISWSTPRCRSVGRLSTVWNVAAEREVEAGWWARGTWLPSGPP